MRLNTLESDMDSDVTCVLNVVADAKAHDAARGQTVATGWNRHVNHLLVEEWQLPD